VGLFFSFSPFAWCFSFHFLFVMNLLLFIRKHAKK
jgi:hypothetical protein